MSQPWHSAERRQVAYPEALRRNTIALKHPVLCDIIPAYAHQIEKAVQRRDLVSLNHRLAALLASCFDIIFACNYQLHPGEKRMLQAAINTCGQPPGQMEAGVSALLMLSHEEIADVPRRVNRLLDRLDLLLG